MNKKQKLYNLRSNIMIEAEKVEVLLKQVTHNDENPVDAVVLSSIALEKTCKISKMNEKIGIILKH